MATGTDDRRRDAALDATCSGPRPERVLDVGCGSGALTLALAARLPTAIVAGVEEDRAALDRARVAGERGGVHVEWRRAASTALPFAAGAFDRVVCDGGLARLRPGDRMRVLRECARVLAPAGRLVVVEAGRPRDPVMRAAALAAAAGGRGPGPSDELLRGLLPARVGAAGLVDVTVAARLRTRAGVVEVLTARSR